MTDTVWSRFGQPFLLSVITLGMGTSVSLLLSLSAKLDVTQSVAHGNSRDMAAMRREFDSHTLAGAHGEAAKALAELGAKVDALRATLGDTTARVTFMERDLRRLADSAELSGGRQ